MALIGANGSGKTSLLRLIAGQDWPDDGEIKSRKGVQISYLPQNVDLPPSMTAIDAVVQSDSPVAAIVREYTHLLEQGDDVDRAVCFFKDISMASDRHLPPCVQPSVYNLSLQAAGAKLSHGQHDGPECLGAGS